MQCYQLQKNEPGDDPDEFPKKPPTLVEIEMIEILVDKLYF